jgi:hypothetical protein
MFGSKQGQKRARTESVESKSAPIYVDSGSDDEVVVIDEPWKTHVASAITVAKSRFPGDLNKQINIISTRLQTRHGISWDDPVVQTYAASIEPGLFAAAAASSSAAVGSADEQLDAWTDPATRVQYLTKGGQLSKGFDGKSRVPIPSAADKTKFTKIMQTDAKRNRKPLSDSQMDAFQLKFKKPIADWISQVGEDDTLHWENTAMMYMYLNGIDPKYFDYFATAAHGDAVGPQAMTSKFFGGGRKLHRKKSRKSRSSRRSRKSRSSRRSRKSKSSRRSRKSKSSRRSRKSRSSRRSRKSRSSRRSRKSTY